MPTLGSDSRIEAVVRSGEFTDPRLRYWWDGHRITGMAWDETLALESLAWDVYFLYGSDAEWQDEPSVPDFWMHQLGGLEKRAPRLDADTLAAKIAEFLKR